MKVNVVLEEKKIPDFEAKYGLDVYNDKCAYICSVERNKVVTIKN